MIVALITLLWLTAVAYWVDMLIALLLGAAVGGAVVGLIAQNVVKKIKRETWG